MFVLSGVMVAYDTIVHGDDFRKQSGGGISTTYERQGRSGKHNEVNILVLGDWQRLAQEMPPNTPVIFRYDGKKPMETEDYCDGLQVKPSRMWDGYGGWKPCILVVLGECF